MPAPAHNLERVQAARPFGDVREDLAAIEIITADHPGSLPQVCGMLARRAFQVEAMLSLPSTGGRRSVWLLVPNDARLEQLMLQVSKLGDVLDVARRAESGPFGALMG